MLKPTAAQVAYFLPRDWQNPISGCTVPEEREKALIIGGRLPHIAYINLHIRRAKIKRDPAVDKAIQKCLQEKRNPQRRKQL